MLIFQIFWRMFVVLLTFEIGIYPFTYLLPSTPELIMWKITIYYGLFSVLLVIFGFASKKGLIGLVKPKGVDMPVFIWPKIDFYYSIVFLLLAIVNGWFVLFTTEEQWINFKLFAPYPVLVCYTIIVSLLVSKDIIKHEQKIA
jgi:intracellular septation protein